MVADVHIGSGRDARWDCIEFSAIPFVQRVARGELAGLLYMQWYSAHPYTKLRKYTRFNSL